MAELSRRTFLQSAGVARLIRSTDGEALNDAG